MTQNRLDFPPLEFLNYFDKFYTIFPKSIEDKENNPTMIEMLFGFFLATVPARLNKKLTALSCHFLTAVKKLTILFNGSLFSLWCLQHTLNAKKPPPYT